MAPTSTSPDADFPKQVAELFLNAIDEGTKQAARILWDILTTFLSEHWFAVLFILFAVLIYAIFRAFLGHWWVLGIVLYNYFYFGVLFVVGLIWGPEIFANDYFKILLVLLYVVCFTLVGKILVKTGLKRY